MTSDELPGYIRFIQRAGETADKAITQAGKKALRVTAASSGGLFKNVARASWTKAGEQLSTGYRKASKWLDLEASDAPTTQEFALVGRTVGGKIESLVRDTAGTLGNIGSRLRTAYQDHQSRAQQEKIIPGIGAAIDELVRNYGTTDRFEVQKNIPGLHTFTIKSAPEGYTASYEIITSGNTITGTATLEADADPLVLQPMAKALAQIVRETASYDNYSTKERRHADGLDFLLDASAKRSTEKSTTSISLRLPEGKRSLAQLDFYQCTELNQSPSQQEEK